MTTNKNITKEILAKIEGELPNPESKAKEIDYTIDMLLQYETRKKELCQSILKNIKHDLNQSVDQKKLETLNILRANVLGKLFYLNLKDNKYLVIDEITKKEFKEQILKEIEIIESCEHNATLFVDQLEGQHKYFINGITSLIY